MRHEGGDARLKKGLRDWHGGWGCWAEGGHQRLEGRDAGLKDSM